MRDLYELSGSKQTKYTVPLLWDTKEKVIVNNESSEIVHILNSQFNDFAKNPDLNLAPEELKEEMASIDEWTYPGINDGVYRCGFART